MNTTASFTGPQLLTYQRIFQEPASHILGWREVLGMFRHLGGVEEEPDGGVRLVRNGQVLLVHPRRPRDVAGAQEISALRLFLEKTETAAPAGAERAHLLLVIDHHEARAFGTELHGAVPRTILPHPLDEHFRHARHSRDFSKDPEKPDPSGFFEAVARALHGAGRVVIIGTGTGTSCEMDQFTAWLRANHPAAAARVIGSIVVDRHPMSDEELLARARDFYAKNPAA